MEDHDEKYSADDIEIWKVYFKNSSHQLIKKEPRYVWDYVRYLSSGLQDECRPFHRFELYDSFSKEYRETVILEELNQSRVGCTLWPSSVVASRLILKNYVVPDRIHRQLAVDVGCGCGLVTLSLLLSGYKVLALDHAEPLVFCKNNIEINDYLRDYRELVEFRAFDWNKQKLDLKDQSISTIVLSDCCYDVFAIDGLLNFLLDVRMYTVNSLLIPIISSTHVCAYVCSFCFLFRFAPTIHKSFWSTRFVQPLMYLCLALLLMSDVALNSRFVNCIWFH